MSQAPAFQLYARDWLADLKLRGCSPAARGAWIDLLCMMHQSTEYGVIRKPLTKIAATINVPVKFLRELVDAEVLKGSDSGAEDYVHTPRSGGREGEPITLVVGGPGPCWYSSRFVRDNWVRSRRGGDTRFSGDRQPKSTPTGPPITPPTGTPNRRVGEPEGNGPAVAFASALKPTPQPPDADASAPPGKPAKRKTVTFDQFAADCRATGVPAIPEGDPIQAYAAQTGLTPEMMRLAWQAFRDRYSGTSKRYADWRQHFRNAVRGNWFHLWYVAENGDIRLSTVGKMTEKVAA